MGLSLAAFSSAFWLKESSHSVFLSCILQGVLVGARPLSKGKAKSENRPHHPCLWGIVWGYSTHTRLLKPKAHAGPGLMREPPPGQLQGLKQGAAVCLGRRLVALSGNYTRYQIQPQHKLKGEKWARKIVGGGGAKALAHRRPRFNLWHRIGPPEHQQALFLSIVRCSPKTRAAQAGKCLPGKLSLKPLLQPGPCSSSGPGDWNGLGGKGRVALEGQGRPLVLPAETMPMGNIHSRLEATPKIPHPQQIPFTDSRLLKSCNAPHPDCTSCWAPL